MVLAERDYLIFTFLIFLVQPSVSGKKGVILNGLVDSGAVDGAAGTGPIDEDLFDDEDLDELEEDLENLEV